MINDLLDKPFDLLKAKWVLVREVIHLAYDYQQNSATQWDYISKLELDDLNSLLDYYKLQKYTKKINIENSLKWIELIQIIQLEIKYRENIEKEV